jgi:hypothetical protein
VWPSWTDANVLVDELGKITIARTVSACSGHFLQMSERAFVMPVEHQS